MSVRALAVPAAPAGPGSTTTSAVLVTASEPEPRSFGKQVVLGGLLDHLVQRLGSDRVHVVLVGRPDVERPATAYRMHVIPKPTAVDQVAALRRVPLRPHSPLQEAALWSPRVRTSLEWLLAGIDADLEIWDTMRVGQYARDLPRHRRVLYADDLFSKRYASMLQQARTEGRRLENPLGSFSAMLPGPARRLAASPLVYQPLLGLEQRLSARSEVAAPRHFDATFLVSQDETAELERLTGSPDVHTLLPLVRTPDPAPRRYDGRPTFVFLGSLDFAPNRDGLRWFLGSCRDAVLRAVPDFRLLVVGRGSEGGMPSEAADWSGRITPLGWVADLDEVLLTSAALLSPLRLGSGTKIKVLEALARGLPVVATEHGVLGLGVDRTDGCLVGQSPAELATLLREAAGPANERLSGDAAASWRSRFCPAVAGRTYDELLRLPTADLARRRL